MNASESTTNCDEVWNFTSSVDASAALERLQWSSTDKWLTKVILPVIVIIGVLANLAFLFTVIRVRRMQTITNYYLVNLAVADVLFLVITLSAQFHTFTHSPFRGNVPYISEHGCWGSVYPIFVSYFASIEFITLVSLERYYTICKPVHHRLMHGKERTIKLIVSAWVVAIVLAAATAPRFGKMKRKCILWPEEDEYDDLPTRFHSCYMVNFGLGLLAEVIQSILLVIALVISCITYYKLVTNLGSKKLGGSVQVSKNKRNLQIRNQVARLLIINGAVFFICQFPSRVMNMDKFVRAVTDTLQPHTFTLFAISFGLLLINSAVNPFIYGLSSRLYRVAFCQAFGIAPFLNMDPLSSRGESFRNNVSHDFMDSARLRRRQSSVTTLDNIDSIQIKQPW